MLTTKRFSEVLKRIITGTVYVSAVLCMVVAMTITSNAVTKGKVIANAAKVRAEANTNSAQVGSVQKDGIVVINEEVTGADGKVWYKVTFDTDKTGYIRSDLMSKYEEAEEGGEGSQGPVIAQGVTPVNPVPAKVSGSQIRVRNSASTAGDIVSTLEKDTIVTVLGTATESNGKIWYQITYNDTVNGFVRSDFVTLQGDLTAPEQTPPEQPGEEEPPAEVEQPPVEEPPVEVETKAMETQLDGEVWYLIDHEQGIKYSIPDLFDAGKKNAELYNKSQDTMKKMKVWMGILLLITFLAVVGATFLLMKYKDMKDAIEFGKTERETLEKRRALKNSQRHEREAGNTKPQGSARPQGTVNAPSGAGQKKPVQKRAGEPQGRMVTDVSGKPVREGRPVASQNKVNAGREKERVLYNEQIKKESLEKLAQKPEMEKKALEPKTVEKKVQEGMVEKKSTLEKEKPVIKGNSVGNEKTAEDKMKQVKPKNFLPEDDDDEFEFEFLNWDEDK